jgi:hypothetical protein
MIHHPCAEEVLHDDYEEVLHDDYDEVSPQPLDGGDQELAVSSVGRC